MLSYKSALLSSDIIIYDLHTADLTDLQDKSKLLKSTVFDTKKTFILVSSIQVWGATKPKVIEKSPEELAEAEDPESEKFKVLEFEESEYMKRKAPEEFKSWKGCETLIMSIGMNKPDLDVYVIASGIIYGNGEHSLEYLFQSAWLQNPEKLPIINDGTNCVPTIHVRDLAKAVKHVILTKPSVHYLFAVDSSPSQLQKDIIKAISNGVGTGLTEHIDFGSVKDHQWAKSLNLNVKVKPSSIFLPPTEEEKEEPEDDIDDEDRIQKPKPIRMEWHCLGGLISEIAKINTEFNETRGLKPITVFITGPPGSGKSYYGDILSKYYNIPRINAEYVASKAKSLQNELGEAIKTKLTELKDEMLEEAENNKKEGEEIDPNTIAPRIPKDLFIKAFKWALKQNACRNRGYVLEGFPKSYEDAWSLFKDFPKLKDEEEPADEEPDKSKMITDFSIFPQSVIEFYGTDEELINKVKELPEENIQGTHFNIDGMNRRFKEYRDYNFSPIGLPSVTDFFKENNVEVLSIHCSDPYTLEASKIYMERFEKPKNYQHNDDIEEEKRISVKESAKEAKKKQALDDSKRHQDLEVDKRLLSNENIKKRVFNIQQEEIDSIEKMAEHVKGYMLENVYEVLASGLTKVCMKKRDDPIDYLAKYLFKHADGIPHPDPYLY